MAKKEKYAWTYSDDNEMFFWSENSTNNYLSGKEIFMPKNLFDEKSGKIKSASKNSPSIFSHYGIIRAGFSRKTKNYYQVIGKNPFFTVFLIERGELPISFEKEKTTLKKGDLLLVPPKIDNITIQIKNSEVSIFWAHIKPRKWKTKTNLREIEIKRDISDAKILFALAHAYESEAYAQLPSFTILSNTAQSISEILTRNVETKNSSNKNWKAKILSEIKSIVAKNKRVPTTNCIAKKLKITLSELNDVCLENFSVTFPKLVLKYKLEHSIELLNKGESVVEVSKKLEYSSAFAFSRAFKNYFETAPSFYTKREKNNSIH